MALASFWRRRHRHREGGSTHGSAGNIPELGKKGSGSASGGGSQFFPRRPSLPGALDKYGQFALSQEKVMLKILKSFSYFTSLLYFTHT